MEKIQSICHLRLKKPRRNSMKVKNAFLGLFLSVTTLACGDIPYEPQHFFLDASETEFIYSLDHIYINQPRELDFLFLTGFGIQYLEWRQLFLDEIQADVYSGECIEEDEEPDNTIHYVGRIALFGRFTEDRAKQIPCDGSR